MKKQESQSDWLVILTEPAYIISFGISVFDAARLYMDADCHNMTDDHLEMLASTIQYIATQKEIL